MTGGAPAGAPVSPQSREGGFEKVGRLSATDISALASMKNVAKCDTWCELQNPANHRVFERKLRPRPPRPRARLPGRHAPRCPAPKLGWWAKIGRPCAPARGGPK